MSSCQGESSRCVAHQAPLQLAAADLSEPPIAITRIVKQHIISSRASKSTHPYRTTVPNVTKTCGIADQAPLQFATIMEPEPPIVVAWVIEEDIRPAVAVEVANPERPAVPHAADQSCG